MTMQMSKEINVLKQVIAVQQLTKIRRQTIFVDVDVDIITKTDLRKMNILQDIVMLRKLVLDIHRQH